MLSGCSCCFRCFMLIAMLVIASPGGAAGQDEASRARNGDASTSEETMRSGEGESERLPTDDADEKEDEAADRESASPAPSGPSRSEASPTEGAAAVDGARAGGTTDSSPAGADTEIEASTDTESDATIETAAPVEPGPEPPASPAAVNEAETEPETKDVTPVVAIEPAERDAPKSHTTPSTGGISLQGSWTKSLLFSLNNGVVRFQPRGWVQPRFDLAVNGEASTPGDKRFDGTGFTLHRGRFGFQAWLFEYAHLYLDTGWKGGSPALIDYFADVGPNNGDGPVGIRVGFFRPYFSRQLLHATTRLAMIDYAKAWTDEALALGLGPSGRQLGMGLQGFVLGGLEYGVGVWNGSDGYDRDGDLMYGGRIAVHPLAMAGVGEALRPGDESDGSVSSRPKLSLGVAFYAENRKNTTSDIATFEYDDVQLKGGFDAAFQYAGVSIQGEVFLIGRVAEESAVRNFLDHYNRAALGVGGYFQLGYTVLRQRLELVGRYDVVDENTEFRGIRHYPTIGSTLFIYGHNLKVQAQYRIDIGDGYKRDDPSYIDNSHHVMLMLQAAI